MDTELGPIDGLDNVEVPLAPTSGTGTGAEENGAADAADAFDLSTEADPFVASGRFLDRLDTSHRQLRSLHTSLRAICHADIGIADKIWKKTFPACWASLEKTEQSALITPLVQLLAKPTNRPALGLPAPLAMMPNHGAPLRSIGTASYSQLAAGWGWAAHGTGLGLSPGVSGGALGPAPPPLNVVRSMLACLNDCRPVPVLLPELSASLAATHNAWLIAVQMLEHQALAAEPTDRIHWVQALSLIYTELGESDRLRALQQRTCAARESHVALSQEAYGHSAVAQNLYLELITQVSDWGTYCYGFQPLSISPSSVPCAC